MRLSTSPWSNVGRRWIVERTFGWLNRSRRLAQCYERTIESDRAFVAVAMIHLMYKRLA
jgi:putative transposase